MTQSLHSQARTTHLIREEIRNSTLPQHELAERYNVSRLTIRKWQKRDSAEDGSHRPNKMHTTLTPEQELIVVALRTTLMLPTDDLLAVTQEFISRQSRCRQRPWWLRPCQTPPLQRLRHRPYWQWPKWRP